MGFQFGVKLYQLTQVITCIAVKKFHNKIKSSKYVDCKQTTNKMYQVILTINMYHVILTINNSSSRNGFKTKTEAKRIAVEWLQLRSTEAKDSLYAIVEHFASGEVVFEAGKNNDGTLCIYEDR